MLVGEFCAFWVGFKPFSEHQNNAALNSHLCFKVFLKSNHLANSFHLTLYVFSDYTKHLSYYSKAYICYTQKEEKETRYEITY